MSKKVCFLTPDTHIDRRILQMCQTLIEDFNVECYILKALETTNVDVKQSKIKIIEIYPQSDLNFLPAKKKFLFRFFQNLKVLINKITSKKDLKYQFENHDFLNEKFYWLHYQFYKKALEIEADLYIACDLPVLPAAVLAANSYKVPVIYDSHELYPEQINFSEEYKQLLSTVERYYIQKAKEVITVNNSIAKVLKERYDLKEIHVILNALPYKAKVEKKDLFRKKFSLSSKKRIVLFQGGFSKFRNLDNLVLAGKFLEEDIVLVFMGFGEYEKELKKLAIKKGILNKKVYFHKAVLQDRLLEYTASADLGIIPYKGIDLNSYYCTPNKLFEYVQAGIPILANDLPELKYFVNTYKLGLVKPLNTPKDIAEAINKFFRLDDLFIRQIKSNIQKAKKILSWNSEKEKFKEIIRKYI